MQLLFHELNLTQTDFHALRNPHFAINICNVTANRRCALSDLIEWKMKMVVPKTVRFDTCALVGGSSLLLDETYGREIESMSTVIRLNSAPTAGFETFVGTRTDVRVWGAYPHSSPANTTAGKETWIMLCATVPWVGWCWRHISKDKNMRFHTTVIDHVSDRIRNATGRQLLHPTKKTRQSPSTGAIALFFAMTYCRRVTAYGFGKSSRPCQKYNKKRCRYPLRNYHDFEGEWLWICHLFKTGQIILKPSSTCV